MKNKTYKLAKLERNRFSIITNDLEHCILCGCHKENLLKTIPNVINFIFINLNIWIIKKGNTDYGSNNETRTSVHPYRDNFTTKSSKNQIVLPINNKQCLLEFDVVSRQNGLNQYRVQRLEPKQKTGDYDGVASNNTRNLPPYSQPVFTKNNTTKSSKNQVVLPINSNMQQNKSNILTNQEIQGINATKSQVEDTVYNKFVK